jgi:hypothetical protein
MDQIEALQLRKGDSIRVRKSIGKRFQRAMVLEQPRRVERWVLVSYALRHSDSFPSDLRSGFHVAVIGQDEVIRD